MRARVRVRVRVRVGVRDGVGVGARVGVGVGVRVRVRVRVCHGYLEHTARRHRLPEEAHQRVPGQAKLCGSSVLKI